MVVALVLKVKVQRAQEVPDALEAGADHPAQTEQVLACVLGGSRVALMAAVAAVLTVLMQGKGESAVALLLGMLVEHNIQGRLDQEHRAKVTLAVSADAVLQV